jgi:hypothetical protein
MINFCFDTFVNDNLKHPWANLTTCNTTDVTYWPELSTMPPYAEFPRLIEYLREYNYPHQFYRIQQAPTGSFYPIDIFVFDHTVDFFDLMSAAALNRLKNREIKVLMYYCEADSAVRIQNRLVFLCCRHGIDIADIYFVQGQTVTAATPSNFYYFDTDLLSYTLGQIEKYGDFLSWHARPRSRKMTILSRVHKSWRAFFHAWLWDKGHNDQSYFSYCMEDCSEDPSLSNNPLHRKVKPSWRNKVSEFLQAAPFFVDDQEDWQRNNHGHRVDYLHADSYWNIVIETHLCLEQDQPGVFITEKTWKAIANCQLFVILGTAGSLAYLKDLGFRTFQEIGIDESYDSIQDHSNRFLAVCQLVDELGSMSFKQLHCLNLQARPIIEHNQQLMKSLPGKMLSRFVNELINGR